MNQTAVLHAAFGVLLVAGILVRQTPLRVGLIGLGIVCFVAGIVLARRDEGSAAAE
ncbi:hypothetical protein RYH80_01455 [Halobaculum sp. MBLA0147]|uniref:hypothetical protein n=1 Tax=Halobaculum sp. MBLA0147 TaxID=3079934 RepID=UPI003525DF60